MSGFCLNVGLCCVNKFKVERSRLGVVVAGRRKALAVLSLISEGKLWHCMVAMTENLQILYPGMGSMPLERAPQPSQATLVLHCYLPRFGSLVNYRNQTRGFFSSSTSSLSLTLRNVLLFFIFFWYCMKLNVTVTKPESCNLQGPWIQESGTR